MLIMPSLKGKVSFYNFASEASYIYFFAYCLIVFDLFMQWRQSWVNLKTFDIYEVKRSILMLNIDFTA